MEVVVRLRLLDQLSGPLNRTLQLLERWSKGSAGEAGRLAGKYQQLGTQVGALADKSQRLSRIRPLAGQVNDADRLASKLSLLQRGYQGLMTAAQAYGGIKAGAAVLKDPIKTTMGWEMRLAHLSNVAYAGKNLSEKRVGMRDLNAAIETSIRTSGGTRDSAVAALEKLVASSAFSSPEMVKLLPILQRYGNAANVDSAALADIGIRSKQNFGIPTEQMGDALDMAIKSGQLGGFELKDMARWLPQQMAMAKQSGMTGFDGLATLLAANQATVMTAGSKDEAGNNLVNLLAKINSRDTSMDAKRLGIDLSGELASARANGVNSLDAFVGLVDKVVAKDTKFQALKARAAQLPKGSEQSAAYESMTEILQGNSVGRMIQDRQALLALIAIMNNRDLTKNIRAQITPDKARGTAENNFSLISTTAEYKTQRASNEGEIALQKGMDAINPALGAIAEKLAGYAQQYPNLTAALIVAEKALMALAAAAGAASVIGLLKRGGAPIPPIPGGTPGAPGAAAGLGARLMTSWRLLAAAPTLGSIGSLGSGAVASSGAAVAGAGVLGYGIGTGLNWAAGKGVSAATDGKHGSMTSLLYDKFYERELAALASPVAQKKPAAPPAPQKVEVDVKATVDVRNGNIVASVNEVNAREARRH